MSEAASLDLPENARAICLYHEERFVLIDGTTPIHEGDEVVILTDAKHLRALRQRFPQ